VSVCRLQRQWLVQFEPQCSFCWHFDGLTACEHLCAGSGSRSRNCTDGCTLASAGNRSDERTQDRTAANHFSCALVCAYPALCLFVPGRLC
jgi:hypothetical protein